MVYPAVKLNQFYSLNLYDGLDIIFEDLDMIDLDVIKEAVKNKYSGNIVLVNNVLSINTKEKSITIIGYKINNSTYIVNNKGSGDITLIKYKCNDDVIFTGLEYLYHMCKTQTRA